MEELAKIYTIKNTKNNIVYVGSTTTTLEERFQRHIIQSREGRDSIFLEDLYTQDVRDFEVKLVDEAFIRHRFIVEEYWWNKLNNEGIPLYDIKRGATHSKNTKQRISQSRQNNGFDYSSEDFKAKMSLKTSGENNGMFGKIGENALNGRIVNAYDKDGEIKHTFPSVKVALEFLGIKGHVKLNEACRTNKEYKGYFWKKEWINR